MSFYDDASLVFLPSGEAGKDGKVYSMKPTNGDGDFTFSRGSNLTATRIDSNGLIEKGRENLLTYSNEFATSPWGVSGLETPTTGESGYDGSADAWLLETSASSGRLRRTTSLSGVNTFSFYAKKGNVDYIAFFGISSGNFPRAWFNLATGNVSNQLNHIDAKMEIIGNGWYRCSITFDEAVTELRIYPTNTAGSFSAGAGETSIIQDAQLEIGLVATEYIESGATTGLAGILEDSPRFDYSGGASCPSLLLEPSRTNEIGYSEYFEGWTPQGSPTITSNYNTSPEGLQNSSRLVFTNGSDYIETSVTNTSGVFSIYAKGTGNIILTDSGANASSTTALTSSYQRIELYFSTNTTTLQIKTDSSGLDAEVYGAQFENATYATSYIPNHSGGSVTREAEKQEITGLTSSVLNQNDGSFYIELQTLSTDSGRVVITSYPTGASNDTIRFTFGSNIQFGLVSASSLSDSTNPSSAKVKVVGTYSRSELKLCVNGGSVQSSSGNFAFANQPTKLYTHAFVDTIRAFANIDKIIYFPSVLSDSEMITLTS